jgi:hypothetical protein
MVQYFLGSKPAVENRWGLPGTGTASIDAKNGWLGSEAIGSA